jgi:hypothetical protein
MMCAVYLCFAQAKYVHMNMASQSSVCLCSSFSSAILSSKQNTIGSRIIPNMLQHSEMRTNLQQQCQQQTQIKTPISIPVIHLSKLWGTTLHGLANNLRYAKA